MTAVQPITEVQPSQMVRYPLVSRRPRVAAVTPLAPTLVRITFTGEDLAGFTAPAPTDHVKLLFPGPDGTIAQPVMTSDGPRTPASGTVIARDYTPADFRPDGGVGPELDIDFVLHGDDGPASAWAARARPGDDLVVLGPRGSHLPPLGVTDAIIIADETALPAARRWIRHFSPEVSLMGLFTVADMAVSHYLDDVDGGRRSWFSGPERDSELEAALRSLAITESSFVFIAGEAGAVVPLRRYLRRELGLPREQVDAHGYWKRGTVNLDHHAPLDPTDPD